jgi:hypothetical protein
LASHILRIEYGNMEKREQAYRKRVYQTVIEATMEFMNQPKQEQEEKTTKNTIVVIHI